VRSPPPRCRSAQPEGACAAEAGAAAEPPRSLEAAGADEASFLARPAQAPERCHGHCRRRRSSGPHKKGVTMNVHVKAGNVTALATKLNHRLTKMCPKNAITFGHNGCCLPHNTLYLTEFQASVAKQNYRAIGEAIAPVKDAFGPPCTTTLKEPRASGSYVLWDMVKQPCLQALSDLVVSQLRGLAVPDQPVPEWVDGLPEPVKTQKKTAVELFGSPNVFFQHGPHITIGYVDDDCAGFPGGLAAAVGELYRKVPEAAEAVSAAEEIGYAVTGKYTEVGAVPANGVVGSLKLV